MRRLTRSLAVLALAILALSTAAQAEASTTKRIAVLHVEDHSGFDPPSGCGCLPLGPLGTIFGRTKRQREYWNLEVGFRDMLVTTLRDAPGYEPVYPEEVIEAYAALGLNAKQMKDEDARRRLSEALGGAVLVVGEITQFKQERAQGMVRRDMSSRGSAGADIVQGGSGTIGMLGSFYDVAVEMEFTVYGRTGPEAFQSAVSDSRSYQSGSVKSGPLEASMSGAGPQAFVGSQQIVKPTGPAPVVRHTMLDYVKFGSPGWDHAAGPNLPPNFRTTLFGRVTQTVLDKFVADMRARIGPSLEDAESDPDRSAMGKVAFTVEDDASVYVNLGSQARIRVGDRLSVTRATQTIRDPDSGEVLGSLDEVVGTLEVIEILRPKLSRTMVVDGVAGVGDVVELLTDTHEADAGESGDQEPDAPN